MLTAVHLSRQEVGRLVSKSNRCEKQGLGGGGGGGVACCCGGVCGKYSGFSWIIWVPRMSPGIGRPMCGY